MTHDVGRLACERPRERLPLKLLSLLEKRIGGVGKGEAELEVGGHQVETLELEREDYAVRHIERISRLDRHLRSLVAHEKEEPIERGGERADPAEQALWIDVHVQMPLEKGREP